MKVYVFVEGAADAELLQHLIWPDLSEHVQFVPARSVDSIRSLARSVLATRREPVAVVVDSESLAPDLVRDRRQSLEELIQAAAASIPAKVVMAVPQLEAIFFHDPLLLPKLFGHPLPADALTRSRFEPGAVLAEILSQGSGAKSIDQLMRILGPEDLEVLKSAPPILELNQFLGSVLKSAQADKPVATP